MNRLQGFEKALKQRAGSNARIPALHVPQRATTAMPPSQILILSVMRLTRACADLRDN
jgi:hypothetical protein